MEIDALCLIATWSTHEDTRKHLYNLSKLTNQKLDALEGSQNFWRDRAQNLFFINRGMPEKAACWKKVCEAAAEKRMFAKYGDRLPLKGLYCLLHQSVITLDIPMLVLVMLDNRLTASNITRVARRLLDPYVDDWGKILSTSLHISEPLAILISDLRVDIYGWLESQIADRCTQRAVLDTVLDEPEVLARLTEEELLELDEQLSTRGEPMEEELDEHRRYGWLDGEEEELDGELQEHGWLSLIPSTEWEDGGVVEDS